MHLRWNPRLLFQKSVDERAAHAEATFVDALARSVDQVLPSVVRHAYIFSSIHVTLGAGFYDLRFAYETAGARASSKVTDRRKQDPRE